MKAPLNHAGSPAKDYRFTVGILFTLLMSLFCSATATAQTLTNGENHAGMLSANTTNSYNFDATTGDTIVLRLGSSGFNGRLELRGPTGISVGIAQNTTDALVTHSVINSGTFTVLVSSFSGGSGGSYVLHYAKIPGAFIVPAGDDGGALTNGGNHAGTIDLADLDMWTFSADAGDSIVLRLGSAGFNGKLELYGPSGLLVGIGQNAPTDALVTHAATNSGTFTVLVSSFPGAGTGSYVLHYAKIPSAFIVPVGDDGGVMTNGGNHVGTIDLADLDMWTFSANAGDSIVLRLGSAGYGGRLELYGPTGLLLGMDQDTTAALVTHTATNSGTFTVLVSSVSGTVNGTYMLYYAKIPGAFIVPAGDDGGALTNGGNHAGTIGLADLDIWTFSASAGESIKLRLGSPVNGGKLELYGPTGLLVGITQTSRDALIAYTATNSGTFTVLVSRPSVSGGSYVLHYAKIPGAFIVPAGDDGGALTNGGNHAGTIDLADLDMWTFSADAGDSIVLRLGSSGFNGKLELYGPSGLLVGISQNTTDALVTHAATNSGTFTVVVSSFPGAGTGSYVLHYVVPPGGEGGSMTGSANYGGTIALADEDLWVFTACKGDFISLQLDTTNFNGSLALYGPNGALQSSALNNTHLSIGYTATNKGTFAVLVSSFAGGGTGSYTLTANGLSDGLKLCVPFIMGTNVTVSGVGGLANAVYIVSTTTNVTTPAAAWTPIWTNNLDQYGTFVLTTVYNRAERERYFRLLQQ